MTGLVAKDQAIYIKDLVDNHYREAEKIIFVMDNLNTHHKSSFYEAFERAEAKRIADRFRNSVHTKTRQLVEHD